MIVLQELMIQINGSKIRPTILNYDFLLASGVIPSDWKVAEEPKFGPNFSQITFTNRVNLVAQPGAFILVEILNFQKKLPIPHIVDIASKLVSKIEEGDYKSVMINPKILISLPDSNMTKDYIMEKIIAPGPWCKIGKAPVQATVNFLYQLDQSALTVSVTPAALQKEDKSTQPALLFSGSFGYNLINTDKNKSMVEVIQYLNRWDVDLKNFEDIVQDEFMGKMDSLF